MFILVEICSGTRHHFTSIGKLVVSAEFLVQLLWQTQIKNTAFELRCTNRGFKNTTTRFQSHSTGWAKKLHQILADFQNSFTVTFSGKFAIKQSLNMPLHLKCVVTLPCEIFTS